MTISTRNYLPRIW